MWKKLLIVAVLASAVAAAVWYQRSHPEPLAVKTATVDRGPVQATVSNTKAGTIKACRRSISW